MKFQTPIQSTHLTFSLKPPNPPSDVNECIYKSVQIGETVLPYVCSVGYHHPDASARNISRFYKAYHYVDILDLVNKSVLMKIVPGKYRQIYLVFDAKKIIGVQIDAKARDNMDYQMKDIDGCLRPVGPIRWTETETTLFSVVYTPRKVNDDLKSLKFVWTTTFPGYPDVRHDSSGLQEGDVIPGTEVNARNLHPITFERTFE